MDDDPDIRLITELALQLDDGWSARAVASAAEARIVLATQWLPDIILADVAMPGGSGLDLIRRFEGRGVESSIPVVLFTASVRQQDVERFKTAGAAGVIAKPFDPLHLGSELRRIFDEHDV